MKITVITVCYNAVETIDATIRSVLTQTHHDVEYILVDGGSDDGTLAIIDCYRDHLAHVVSEPDEGIYDAMNKGIQLAHGDLLFFLNSDDFLADVSVIAQVVEAYQPGDDILFGDLLIRNTESGQTTRRSHRKVTKPSLFDHMISQPATFYTRMAFKSCGVFDSRFQICGDYEWLMRAVKSRLHFHYIELPITIFYMGGISNNPNYELIHHKERKQITDAHFSKCERALYPRISWRLKKYVPFLWPIVCRIARWDLP